MSKKIIIFAIAIFIFQVSFMWYKWRIYKKNGENKEITGDFNKDLSITCKNGIFVGTKKEIHYFF